MQQQEIKEALEELKVEDYNSQQRKVFRRGIEKMYHKAYRRLFGKLAMKRDRGGKLDLRNKLENGIVSIERRSLSEYTDEEVLAMFHLIEGLNKHTDPYSLLKANGIL